MDDLITIDLKPAILAKDEAGNFIVTQEAEKQVITILEAKDLIDDIIEQVKTKLAEVMNEQGLSKVEGAKVIALKMFFGARYEVFDRDIALQGGFATLKESVTPEIAAIDKFIKETGKLPEGIKLRERSEGVTIKLRKEKEIGS